MILDIHNLKVKITRATDSLAPARSRKVPSLGVEGPRGLSHDQCQEQLTWCHPICQLPSQRILHSDNLERKAGLQTGMVEFKGHKGKTEKSV